jgi:hypothetical protein
MLALSSAFYDPSMIGNVNLALVASIGLYYFYALQRRKTGEEQHAKYGSTFDRVMDWIMFTHHVCLLHYFSAL